MQSSAHFDYDFLLHKKQQTVFSLRKIVYIYIIKITNTMETRGNVVLISLDDQSQIVKKRISAFNIENLLWKTKTKAILNASDRAYKHNLNRINKYMTKTKYDAFATITNDNLLYVDTDRAFVVSMADMEKDKRYYNTL